MSNRDLVRAARSLRKKGNFLRGLLGDFSGTIEVLGRPGYYYVRLDKPGGYEVGVFPGRVRPLNNLPVRVETHPLTGVQYIVGPDDETLIYGGADPADVPVLDIHGDTHGWGGDDMAVWLHTQQIFPLRCQPSQTDPLSVVIQAGTFFSQGAFTVLDAPLEVSLAEYFPASGYKYVLLYMLSTGEAEIQDSSVQYLRDLVAPPEGTFWVAALRLAAGSNIGWPQIVDLRFLNSGVINAGKLKMGEDFIVVGAGHPDTNWRWVRLGTMLDALLDTTRGTGMLAVDSTDYVFLGVDRVAADEGRASLIWGDNLNDDLWIAHYNHITGEKTYVARITPSGNIILLDGALVDGVDVGLHDHSGEAGLGLQFPFEHLSNVPNSLAGRAGNLVTVNVAETGLVFTDPGAVSGSHPIHRWHVDGPLAAADEVDGVWVVQSAFVPMHVWIYCEDPGTLGSTIVDIQRSTSLGNSWTTLFAIEDMPELEAGADLVSSSKTDALLLNQGTLLRCNIVQAAVGSMGLTVQFAPVKAEDESLMTIMGIA